jgi:hypothetical protein
VLHLEYLIGATTRDFTQQKGTMFVSEFMDYAMLGLTSFFLADDDAITKPRMSLLWAYFLPPELRAVMYSGLATSLLYQSLIGTSRSLTGIGLVASTTALFCTSYLNLFNPSYKLFPKMIQKKDGTWVRADKGLPERERKSWSTHANDSLGFMGAWWMGAGNGDWFAFIGHNGSDEVTILPSIILEQMSVKRTAPRESHVIIEELGETEDIQMEDFEAESE